MASAATVEATPASTMEAAPASAMKSSAAPEAPGRTASKAASTGKAAPTRTPPPACKPTSRKATSAEATAKASAGKAAENPSETPTPKARSTEPRTGADEQSTREPIRSVVAIRCASVRVIPVISVIARRRCAKVDRSKPHAHTHLSLRVGQGQHQNTDQSQMFYVSHKFPLVLRSAIPATNPPDLQVFRIFCLSEAPMYLNSGPKEKLQSPRWLISATPPEFNHLPARFFLASPESLAWLVSPAAPRHCTRRAC